MKPISVIVAVALVVVVAGCDLNGETDEAGSRPSVSVSTAPSLDLVKATSSSGVDGTAQGSDSGEVFAPVDDPEVVFTGPLEASAGSLVVRFAPNSWYQESGAVALPSVGDLLWFLGTEDGCLVVDRSTFIEVTGPGHEITITPAPGGETSIGESIPLWIEGDWLIHDGCAKQDPIILSQAIAESGSVLGSSDWEVVAAGRSPLIDDLGTVSLVDSADSFAAVLSSLDVGQELGVPNFEDVVVAAFTVPDGLCGEPLEVLGFEASPDGAFTPLFDLEQTRSCRSALVATTYVVSIKRSALPPGSSLRLPGSTDYGYPESVVAVPAN